MEEKIRDGQRLFLFIVIIWFLLMLCSCKTAEPLKEVHTVELEQQGINWSDRSDWSNEKVTITIRDSVVVIVDSLGNERKREEYHERETDREYREKYEELLSMYEGLRSEKVDTIQVPCFIEKKLGFWENVCLNYGGESIFLNIVFGLFCFYFIFRLKR